MAKAKGNNKSEGTKKIDLSVEWNFGFAPALFRFVRRFSRENGACVGRKRM